MKNTVLFVLLFSFFSCQVGPAIKGEGEVVSRDIELEAIEGIHISVPGNIFLAQGAQQSVKLEGQANILDNLKFEFKRKNCYVSFKERAKFDKPLNLYFTIPALTKIKVSGSA